MIWRGAKKQSTTHTTPFLFYYNQRSAAPTLSDVWVDQWWPSLNVGTLVDHTTEKSHSHLQPTITSKLRLEWLQKTLISFSLCLKYNSEIDLLKQSEFILPFFHNKWISFLGLTLSTMFSTGFSYGSSNLWTALPFFSAFSYFLRFSSSQRSLWIPHLWVFNIYGVTCFFGAKQRPFPSKQSVTSLIKYEMSSMPSKVSKCHPRDTFPSFF